ncbi:hypothetical protein ACFS07_31070 [Undibacterium arcticum]
MTAALRKQGVDAGILMPGYPSAMDTAKSLRSVGTLHDLPGGAGILAIRCYSRHGCSGHPARHRAFPSPHCQSIC